MKVISWGDGESLHLQPGLARDSEYEQYGCDPKEGELCLNRMKPGEILVEVRSGSDVQIDR